MQELGLLCGTFNPIHWGHLLIAESAYDQFDLNKVLFITSANPPHRRVDLLDMESRHEMVAAAVADNSHFEASRMELDRPGPSYTVNTLRELAKTYGPGVRLNLILGGDNLDSLKNWHAAADICKLCRILVAPRTLNNSPQPSAEQAQASEEFLSQADLETIDFPGSVMSSSVIRERLRSGKSVLYMVTPRVNDLLLSKGHYSKSSSRAYAP